MALNPNALKAAASLAIFNKLNADVPPEMPPDADLAAVQEGLQRLADAVAEAMPEIITHFISNAQIQVTVPPGTFLVGAQAGVPNPAPVPVDGVIIA